MEYTVKHEQRFCTADDGAKLYCVSPQTFRKFCKKIGAEKRIGKRCIYDIAIIDENLANDDDHWGPVG